MLGESSLGETVIGGETLGLAAPPVEPDVTVTTATKTLVFIVEIDLFQPIDATTPSEPEPEPLDTDTLVYGADTVTYSGQTVGYAN
jgi:hypothetical protein